ncbi:hypothetical protein AAFF_G00193360 [Aldrovandia affinis]|uniref:Uncharacterized protein n=1 Tax=Aldrovandia affinis TaxID=143900 RepID=A0AAD7SX64_9TELE|nr:hypothetical protein AAFF_G00193360 [Aldrovandia affinis]
MSTHHLKLNLGKTELLFLPAKGSPMIDASITVEGSIVSPSQSARSLGVTLDNQLCFSRHIAAITRTCRFSLHNIRRIRPFLTQEDTQLLVQALVISRLDYCNSLLAGLPACAIKPLQLVQNAAARLVFNQPKFTHVTPLPSSLLSALAPHHSTHQIQITGACFSSGQRYCSPLPPVTHHSLHPSQTPPLRLLWQTDCPFPPGAWQPLLAVSPLLCPDPSLVERPSTIGQDRGITCDLPQETQNPPLQTPLPLNSVHLAKLSSPLFTCSTLYSKKNKNNVH